MNALKPFYGVSSPLSLSFISLTMQTLGPCRKPSISPKAAVVLRFLAAVYMHKALFHIYLRNISNASLSMITYITILDNNNSICYY